MNKKRRKILSYTDHHNNEYVLYGDKDKKYTIHDCLTSIVTELDDKGAILEEKNRQINRIYEDYTNLDHRQLDDIVNSLSPKSRIWVE